MRTLLALVLVSTPWLLLAEDGKPEGKAAQKDQYLYLFNWFDTDGFAAEGGSGDFDGMGQAFPEAMLPKGRTIEVDSSRYGKVLFLKPKLDARSYNLLSMDGQTIQVKTKGNFNLLLSLGAAHASPKKAGADDSNDDSPSPGDVVQFAGGVGLLQESVPFSDAVHSGFLRLRFKDGTETDAPIGFSPWNGEAALGEEVGLEGSYRAKDNDSLFFGAVGAGMLQRGISTGDTLRLWLQRTPIPEDKVLSSITLPRIPNAKLLGLTLASRPAVSLPRRPSRARIEKPQATEGRTTIAIFDEPGFPRYQAPGTLGFDSLRAQLEPHGLAAARFSSEHLASRELLDSAVYPVLILPQGSTFPEPAIESVAAYQKSGGHLVLTGRGFGRILRETAYGTWIDIYPDASLRAHDGERGLGVVPFLTTTHTRVWPTEELISWGFPEALWAEIEPRDEVARTTILPSFEAVKESPVHEITPLLRNGGWTSATAAIVRHKPKGWRSSITVYTPTLPLWHHGGRPALDLQREVIARAALYCLHASGKLPDEAWTQATKPYERSPTDGAAPEPVAAVDAPFAGPAVARGDGTLWVVDVSRLDDRACMTLVSAQGLLHRVEGPSLFLQRGTFPLDAIRESRAGKGLEKIAALEAAEVIDLVGHRNAVIVDPDLPGSLDVATMVAAAEGFLVAYPSSIEKWKLEVAFDLRGVFSHTSEMLAFTRTQLLPRLSTSAILDLPSSSSTWQLRDLAIRDRLPCISVSESRLVSSPAVVRADCRSEVERIFRETPLLLPVIGATAAPTYSTQTESTGPALASLWGKRWLTASTMANQSLVGRFESHEEPLLQRAEKALPFDARKCWIAVVDDGDLAGSILPESLSAQAALRAGFQAARLRLRGGVLQLDSESSAKPELNLPAHASSPLDPRSISVDDLFAKSAADGSPETGGTLAWNGTSAPFAGAFGPEAGRTAAKAWGEAVGKALESAKKSWLRLQVTGPGDDATLDHALRALPKGTAVFATFAGAEFGTSAVQVDPLSATERIDGTLLFRELPMQDLQALLTGDGLDRLRPVFPLFLTAQKSIVEMVHQSGEISDDVIFVSPEQLAKHAAEYLAHRRLVTRMIVPPDAEWRYDDNGKDLGVTWRKPGFDDSGWRRGVGEFGYGDEGEGRPERTVVRFGEDESQKHITTYFRTPFEVPEGPRARLLLLEVLADDGCIVYLNGKEVTREGFDPDQEVDFQTTARIAKGPNTEEQWHRTAVETAALQPGRNLLAVEVHQSSPRSSDLSFHLRMTACRWQKAEPAAPKDELATPEAEE